jgi:hypothetical protein
MLVVVSDTHERVRPRLEGRTREAVRAADRVVHAGDFVTERVLDGFEATCADAGAAFEAVHGNNDPPAVRDRLPAGRTVAYGGLRFAVAHGHEHSGASLPLFAREADADCAVVGHSHRPSFGDLGGVPVLNPGSHARPRGHRPAHAELVPAGAGFEDGAGDRSPTGGPERGGAGDGGDAGEGPALDGRLVTPAGETFERFRLEKR